MHTHLRRMARIGLALLLFVTAFAQPSSTRAAEMLATECFNAPGITHCLEGRFLDYWKANGGLPVFGYPITAAADELNRDTNKTYMTQWLERNRFEVHPENAGTPYEVLLGLLGKDRLTQLGRNPAAEPRESGQKAGCLWFEQTGHNVCNQGNNLGFRRYWESNGLKIPGLDTYARSLQLFGLPLTEPRMETNSSGDTVLTQWFERARFEWHPNNPDNFKVLLGLLGKEVRQGGNTPPPAGNACEGVSPPVSGRVMPSNCDKVGTVFILTFFGFTPNEEVGYWLTDPSGEVYGTTETLNVGSSGGVTGPFDTEDLDPGIWQWTMQGTSSKHQSVIYIKLLGENGQVPQPQQCSGAIPAPQNGKITPTCIKGETAVSVTGTGFQPGEKIAFYATEPSQAVYDLGEILEEDLLADDSGNFRLDFFINGRFLDPGAYAITFEGRESGHKTIVYFEGQP